MTRWNILCAFVRPLFPIRVSFPSPNGAPLHEKLRRCPARRLPFSLTPWTHRINSIDFLFCISAANAAIFIQFDSDAAFGNASVKYADKGFTFHPENNTLQLFSVPLRFSANSASFAPVSALLLADNSSTIDTSSNNTAYARSVIPASPFYSYESWAAWRFDRSDPAVLIAYAGSYAVGGYQVNSIGNPAVTAKVDVPIVHISAAAGETLVDLLNQNYGVLNITVTDYPTNPFFERKSGGLFIFYSVVLCAWSFGILVFGLITLYIRKPARNLGTLCLYLDILGAVVRFIFGLDPWADRFMPPQVIDTIFTASWTIVISGTILLLLFWHELATQVSLDVGAALSSHTIPAIAVISALFVIEIVSDGLRAVRVR